MLKTGLAKVVGGTGAYARLKGTNLKFSITRPNNGTTGTVSITGAAKYT